MLKTEVRGLRTENSSLLDQLRQLKARLGMSLPSTAAAGATLCVVVLSMALFFPGGGALHARSSAMLPASGAFRGRTLQAIAGDDEPCAAHAPAAGPAWWQGLADAATAGIAGQLLSNPGARANASVEPADDGGGSGGGGVGRGGSVGRGGIL